MEQHVERIALANTNLLSVLCIATSFFIKIVFITLDHENGL